MFLKGIELKYDDVKLDIAHLTNLKAEEGKCPQAVNKGKKSNDEDKDKETGTVEEAYLKFSYDVSDTVVGLDLKKVLVELKTTKDLGYNSWFLSEANIHGTLSSGKTEIIKLNYEHLEIGSNNSYSCTGLEFTKSFLNEKKDKEDSFLKKFQKLTIKDLQLQPFKEKVFVDSYSCATWFTIGTFAGLIILILFTSILAFGLLYIMTIKANDR